MRATKEAKGPKMSLEKKKFQDCFWQSKNKKKSKNIQPYSKRNCRKERESRIVDTSIYLWKKGGKKSKKKRVQGRRDEAGSRRKQKKGGRNFCDKKQEHERM